MDFYGYSSKREHAILEYTVFWRKEKLRMTKLGKRLIDEGKNEKTIEIVKRAIKKGMDNETIKEITDLDVDKIELIRKVLK